MKVGVANPLVEAHSRAPTSRSAGALGPLAQLGLRKPPQPTAVDARAHRRFSPGDDSLSAPRPPPVVGPRTGSDLSFAGTPTNVLGPAEDLAPSGNCGASAVGAAQDEEGFFAGGTRARLQPSCTANWGLRRCCRRRCLGFVGGGGGCCTTLAKGAP